MCEMTASDGGLYHTLNYMVIRYHFILTTLLNSFCEDPNGFCEQLDISVIKVISA